MDRETIKQTFQQYFQIIPADNEKLRKKVFETRYSVYCAELGFEDRANFPDGLEKDSYDEHSRHCLLLHKQTDQHAGCVRLVFADPKDPDRPFPFESACKGGLRTDIVDPKKLDRQSFGEISRLAVIANFRRRPGEQRIPEELVPDPRQSNTGRRLTDCRTTNSAPVASEHRESPERRIASGEAREGRDSRPSGRRVFPHIAVGLYLAAASIGLMTGLDSVFAMMEPRLARRLRYYGINFRQVGEVIEYHGKRGPFYIMREDLYEGLSSEIQGLLDAVQQDLVTAQTWKTAAS